MKNITNYLIYIIIAVGIISCGANTSSTSNTSNKLPIKTIHLTKAEFLKKVVDYESNTKEWKYLGDKPAIIDFYASWCGPCKVIAPILEELAREYDGQIYVYKIDTEKEEEISSAFGITSIPTLLFIPMGESPQISQGSMPKSNFKEIIDNFLLKKNKTVK